MMDLETVIQIKSKDKESFISPAAPLPSRPSKKEGVAATNFGGKSKVGEAAASRGGLVGSVFGVDIDDKGSESSESNSTCSISRSSSEGSYLDDGSDSISEFELASRYPHIPNLSLNVRKIATQRWNNCQFIYSSLKAEYQVKNVPIAHWGIKDILIVGACPVPRKITAYPMSNIDYVRDQTRTMLTRLISEHKVTVFMSLMAECDDENGDEKSVYRPYSKLDLPVIDPTVKFFKLGIKDCNVTDDGSVLGFAKHVVRLLQSGEKVYLHCWGGHGRAGTVYCLVLQLLYGMSASEALDHCQRVHDCRESFITVGSPQTLVQANQVRRIVDSLNNADEQVKTDPEL